MEKSGVGYRVLCCFTCTWGHYTILLAALLFLLICTSRGLHLLASPSEALAAAAARC